MNPKPPPSPPQVDVALVEVLKTLEAIKELVAKTKEQKEETEKLKGPWEKLQELVKGFGKALQENIANPLAKMSASFTGLFTSFASGFGVARNQLVELAAAANPAGAVLFNQALRALSYTVGQTLQPVLQFATKLLQGLADTLANMSPATKALVAGLAVATVAFAAVATAATAAAIAINAGLGGVPIILAGIVAAVAGTATALVGFGAGLDGISEALAPLKELWSSFLDLIDDAAEAIMGKTASAVQTLVTGFKTLMTMLKPVIDELTRLGRALGSLGSELAKLAGEGATALLALMVPALKVLADGVAVVTRRLTELVVGLQVLAKAARGGYLFDTERMAQDFNEIMGRLEAVKRERDKVAAGPRNVSFTTAEQFGRDVQKKALEFSFANAGKGDDPAKRAEAQRNEQIDLLKEIAGAVNEKAQQGSGPFALGTQAANVIANTLGGNQPAAQAAAGSIVAQAPLPFRAGAGAAATAPGLAQPFDAGVELGRAIGKLNELISPISVAARLFRGN